MGELMSSEGGLIQTGPFGSQLKQSEYTTEGVPVIMPKDIRNGTIDTDSVARIPEARTSSLARHRVKVNSIVFPRRGEITKRAFITPDHENWICGTGCLKIEPQGKLLDPRFLYYFMGTGDSVDWLLKNAVGSTMLNLSAEIMSRFPISVPPIDVQKRIASSLSTYDDLIENNRRRISLLEEAARLLYREWFVHFRFPGHEHVRIINGVPETFEVFELGNVCKLRGGNGFKTKFQGLNSGDYPFIKVGDMNSAGNSVSITEANNWISEIVAKELKAKPFPSGTVIFAKIGEALKQNRVRIAIRDTIIDNNMMGAIPDEEFVSPAFLYYTLSSYDIASHASGAAVPFLTAGVLSRIKFPIPNITLRINFDSIVDPIQKQIANLQVQITSTARARDLLLPRLMDGKLEV